jgi:WD40 repeat protein
VDFSPRFKTGALNRPDHSHCHFLAELRDTWNYSDPTGEGFLTEEQWMRSSLRSFLPEGEIADDLWRRYFYRIDTNSTGVVTWDGFVRYLIKEIASTQLGSDNQGALFVQKSGTVAAVRGIMHRDMVQLITVCNSSREYVTMSDDSIRFWDRYDLHFKRAITEPGMFAAMVLVDDIQKLIAATMSRRLMIFDLETSTKLPFEISASPSGATIKGMTSDEAKASILAMSETESPLSNCPTAMCLGPVVDGRRFCCFVADDQGDLQVFDIIIPARYTGIDYRMELFARYTMHQGSITQMTALTALACYATSSQDMSVKMWSFDRSAAPEDRFVTLRVFRDTEPILRFFVSQTQKVLLTTGISRDAYVWSFAPIRRISKLGGHYNQLVDVTQFELSTGAVYYVTLTNRKEFVLWDAVNHRLVREFADPDSLRPENYYSAMWFDPKLHCLITASSVPVRWAENESLMGNLMEPSTHHVPIVGCYIARPFDQILTVDAVSNFKLWDCETGRLASYRRTEWTASSSRLTCCSLDVGCRRLFTASFDNITRIWNYNSGDVLSSVSVPPAPAIVSVLCYSCIGGRNCLIRAGWDRTVWLFAEAEPGEFTLYRQYRGHTDDISAIVTHDGGLVTGNMNGELFGWTLDTSSPNAVYRVPKGAAIEALHYLNHVLYVATGDGALRLLLVPRLTELKVVPACQGITVGYSLCALTIDEVGSLLYTADTLGYIKKWKISLTHIGHVEPQGLTRISNDEITKMMTIRDGKFLIVATSDMNVSVWHAATFQLVGMLCEGKQWKLTDESTWVGQNPFEPHPDHFVPLSPMGATSLTTASVKSTRVLSGVRSMVFGSLSDTKEVDEEKPFTMADANQAMAEITDVFSRGRDLPKLMHTEPARTKAELPTALPSTIRPMELVSKIHAIWNRPKTVQEAGKRSLRKATLRLPIPTKTPEFRVHGHKQNWARLLM